MKKNQRAREELEILYGAKIACETSNNNINDHFPEFRKPIVGGKETIDNGAVLNREAHDFLHEQEHKDKQLYNELNECLILYKLCLELNEQECLNEWEKVKEQVRIRVR